MKLRRAAAVVSFWGALGIGMAAAYIAGYPTVEEAAELAGGDVYVTYNLYPHRVAETVPVEARSLVGVWTGTWGYERGRCTIEIHRVEGTTFYGTLRKEGAVISLEGYIDPAMRTVHFKETRVVRLGAEMGKWSLGINSGTFAADGRTLSGTGTDEWGTYGWDATKLK